MDILLILLMVSAINVQHFSTMMHSIKNAWLVLDKLPAAELMNRVY